MIPQKPIARKYLVQPTGWFRPAVRWLYGFLNWRFGFRFPVSPATHHQGDADAAINSRNDDVATQIFVEISEQDAQEHHTGDQAIKWF